MRRPISITALFLFLLILTAALPPTIRAADEQLEYKLKAAFLLNFAKFTSWPDSALDDGEFRLCILGESPFGAAFAGIEQKTVASLPIKLILAKDLSQAKNCNMIYISKSEKANVLKIISETSLSPTLLVSDIDGFAENGGDVELTTVNRRLGFNINQTQAQKAGLKFNASLLDLANEVL